MLRCRSKHILWTIARIDSPNCLKPMEIAIKEMYLCIQWPIDTKLWHRQSQHKAHRLYHQFVTRLEIRMHIIMWTIASIATNISILVAMTRSWRTSWTPTWPQPRPIVCRKPRSSSSYTICSVEMLCTTTTCKWKRILNLRLSRFCHIHALQLS